MNWLENSHLLEFSIHKKSSFVNKNLSTDSLGLA